MTTSGHFSSGCSGRAPARPSRTNSPSTADQEVGRYDNRKIARAAKLRQRPLSREFYDRDTVAVARDLLGLRLVCRTPEGLTAGRIVEVEAYLPHDDPANHAFRGRTRKNASMFGPPGHAYVYAIHSRWCLNLVTEPAGVPSAVLIRAIEPTDGLNLMRTRRAQRNGSKLRDVDLARGPARLCEAFGIDRALDGWDLTAGTRLWVCLAVADDRVAPESIVTAPRVGVTSGADLRLRYFIADSPFVSRPKLR
jgi:DNA-3-methyladenine glycosylase